MTDRDLSDLKKRSLSVLRIGADDWYDFEASRGGGVRFTIVVPYEVARQATSRTPVLIVLPGGVLDRDRYFFEDERTRAPQLRLGWISSIQKVATRQSRLAFDHITSLEPASRAGSETGRPLLQLEQLLLLFRNCARSCLLPNPSRNDGLNVPADRPGWW